MNNRQKTIDAISSISLNEDIMIIAVGGLEVDMLTAVMGQPWSAESPEMFAGRYALCAALAMQAAINNAEEAYRQSGATDQDIGFAKDAVTEAFYSRMSDFLEALESPDQEMESRFIRRIKGDLK